jgi:hypothetical protein
MVGHALGFLKWVIRKINYVLDDQKSAHDFLGEHQLSGCRLI